MLPKIPYFVLFRVNRLCNLLLATKLQYQKKRDHPSSLKEGSKEAKRGFLPSFLPLQMSACVCEELRNPSGHHMAVSRIGYGTRQVKVHLSYISNHGSSAGRPSTTLLRV